MVEFNGVEKRVNFLESFMSLMVVLISMMPPVMYGIAFGLLFCMKIWYGNTISKFSTWPFLKLWINLQAHLFQLHTWEGGANRRMSSRISHLIFLTLHLTGGPQQYSGSEELMLAQSQYLIFAENCGNFSFLSNSQFLHL